jgi:DNA invertase Pin-like site-specific DNA recombinase
VDTLVVTKLNRLARSVTALAMVPEFEAHLARMRTRDGIKVAQAKGRLRGKQPKLNPRQQAHLVALHATGEHTSAGFVRCCRVDRIPGGAASGVRVMGRFAAAKPARSGS